MYEDWPKTIKVLSAQLHSLRGGALEIMKAFSGIAQTALAPKVLDTKTKELIALGIGAPSVAMTASPFTSRRHCSKAPRARKSARHSAWRFTWEPVRR